MNRETRLDAAWERVRQEEAGRADARFRVRAALVILLWAAMLAYALVEKFIAR